ncbi:hypothetical protein GW17_00029636 [Ensete ventricosum]|nr:hypothetical protein GW17_00029636 [Ensete ventricosum]
MVWTIPASAWTWLVRPRKASVVTMNTAGFDAGEGNPGSVIILQKRLGVCTAVVASSVGRGWSGAYIVGVVDHPYLATRLPLWLTLSSYASTTPVVLAVRDASTGEGIGLTCVRSAVRLLGYRPYMCQVDRTIVGDSALPVPGRPHDHWRPHTCIRPAYHVGSTILTD